MIDFRRQGKQRDNKLIEILTEWGVLDARQIQLLLYPSARVAQRRLTALVQKGKIKRSTQTSPYFYYTVVHKEPLQRIAINWARMWLDCNRKSWERISFDYSANICTLTNIVRNINTEYHITDHKFKLPGDNVITISDEFINTVREGLKNA